MKIGGERGRGGVTGSLELFRQIREGFQAAAELVSGLANRTTAETLRDTYQVFLMQFSFNYI